MARDAGQPSGASFRVGGARSFMSGVPQPADGVVDQGISFGMRAVNFDGPSQDAADGGVGAEGEDVPDSAADLLTFRRDNPFGSGKRNRGSGGGQHGNDELGKSEARAGSAMIRPLRLRICFQGVTNSRI